MTSQSARHGFSTAAGQIKSISEGQGKRFREAQTFSQGSILEELWDVWETCKEKNWDGYDALPVPQECYQYAAQLIQTLGYGFPKPSFGAEPDGELTIEWYKNPYRTISISVTKDGYLHYSALFGPKVFQNGTEEFNGELPVKIRELIQQVYR